MPRESNALRLALAGLAGSSIEWYDFFLYATAAALVFPTTFFPATLPPFAALIASFATFAVGFVARPIGAVVFGHVGDRLGRKSALVGALIMMGLATALIGLLPTYRTAGVYSPLALVLLRLAQGLAVGGQWGGAVLLATESAPKSRRGLYGSIAQAGVPVGVVLSNLALLAVSGATSPRLSWPTAGGYRSCSASSSSASEYSSKSASRTRKRFGNCGSPRTAPGRRKSARQESARRR